jgi:CRP/FNR family transcriptional regulator, nitrogen oxide reductase regulator
MPELAQAIRLLQEVPLFRGIDSTELSAVATAAQSCRVESGEFFFQQGATADIIYVLQQGRVKLTQSTPEGLHVVFRFIGPGELFGPMAAFEGQVYPVSAQAVRWCRALCWRGRTMAGLMETYPRIAISALRELTARLQDLRERYRELATERVERRVAHALIRLAGQAGWKTEDGVLIDMPLSRQDLAEMTGTTLYTVSRILCGWQRDGLLDIGRQRVTILDSAGLIAITADLQKMKTDRSNR